MNNLYNFILNPENINKLWALQMSEMFFNENGLQENTFAMFKKWSQKEQSSNIVDAYKLSFSILEYNKELTLDHIYDIAKKINPDVFIRNHPAPPKIIPNFNFSNNGLIEVIQDIQSIQSIDGNNLEHFFCQEKNLNNNPEHASFPHPCREINIATLQNIYNNQNDFIFDKVNYMAIGYWPYQEYVAPVARNFEMSLCLTMTYHQEYMDERINIKNTISTIEENASEKLVVLLDEQVNIYNRRIKECNDDKSKIETIIKLVRMFIIIHPLTDSNCRTGYVLLNHLLAQNNIDGCILKSPDRLLGFSTAELYQEVLEGQERLRQLDINNVLPFGVSEADIMDKESLVVSSKLCK